MSSRRTYENEHNNDQVQRKRSTSIGADDQHQDPYDHSREPNNRFDAQRPGSQERIEAIDGPFPPSHNNNDNGEDPILDLIPTMDSGNDGGEVFSPQRQRDAIGGGLPPNHSDNEDEEAFQTYIQNLGSLLEVAPITPLVIDDVLDGDQTLPPKPPFYKLYPKLTASLIFLCISVVTVLIAGVIIASGPAAPVVTGAVVGLGLKFGAIFGTTIATAMAPYAMIIGALIVATVLPAANVVLGMLAGTTIKLYNKFKVTSIDPAKDFKKHKSLLLPLLKNRNSGEKIKRRRTVTVTKPNGESIQKIRKTYAVKKRNWKGKPITKKFTLKHSIQVGKSESGDETVHYVMPGKKTKGPFRSKQGAYGQYKRVMARLQLVENNGNQEIIKDKDKFGIKKSTSPKINEHLLKQEVIGSKAIAIEGIDLRANSLMVRQNPRTSQNEYSYFMRHVGPTSKDVPLPKKSADRTRKAAQFTQDLVLQARSAEKKGYINTDIKSDNTCSDDTTGRAWMIDGGGIKLKSEFASMKTITNAYRPPDYEYNFKENRLVMDKAEKLQRLDKWMVFAIAISIARWLTKDKILGPMRQLNSNAAFCEPLNMQALFDIRDENNAVLIDLLRMMLTFDYDLRPSLATVEPIIKNIVEDSEESLQQAKRQLIDNAKYNEELLAENEARAKTIFKTQPSFSAKVITPGGRVI